MLRVKRFTSVQKISLLLPNPYLLHESQKQTISMRSIFIGRFQPIHLGHMHTIKQILDKGEELVIAIGSAQYSHTPNNPFTGGERVMLIKRALLDAGLPVERIDIIPIPDININPLWIAHLKSYVCRRRPRSPVVCSQ